MEASAAYCDQYFSWSEPKFVSSIINDFPKLLSDLPISR